jgi:tRNA uridine 5-carboxymethylaminomethyl modification enzyme
VAIEQVAPDAVAGIDPAVVAEVVQDARYAPYLERQAEEVARLRADEEILLPDTIDYRGIPGLSSEMVSRLTASQPRSLAAAARVRGVTPAALSAVLLHTKRRAA